MRNLWLILSVFWLWTCSGGGDKATGPEEPPIVIDLTSLDGQAQKGPFNNGTAINIAELTPNLSPTGRNFSSAIIDNTGRFAVANVRLESPYVELRANGYYFNEVSNEISSGQLTLFALSNLTGKTSLNVNIITHLEKNRMVTLMSGDSPKTFAQAKLQAQEEVFAVFDYSRANVPESELLDISQGGAANGKLLAMSAIIQGDLTVGQMSQLLANISTDIASDGTLDDTSLRATLINNSQNLDMAEVRSHLVAHYSSLGISATIPDFETEINQFLKPPVADDISVSVGEDTSINVTLAGSDPEGESLTYTILEVNNATVTLNGNVATYTPVTHFNGTDTFTYYANDGTSDSNIATVTMTVSAEDDEPNTIDVATTTDEDVAVTVNLSADEYDGDSYSFAIITDVSNGTTSLNGSVVTYTPNQDFYGEDTFTFEATDDTGRTINVATATITVNAVNDAPVANDITNQITDENRMMQLDITLDATDVDGDALTYSVISSGNASVTINDNIATYVPNLDWNGEDSFTYVANDGSVDSNTATVTITVNAVNDIPVVNDASVSGDEDATSSVGGSSINGFKFILPEATDIESGSSDDFHNSLEIVTLPTHGKIYSNNNEGDDSPENELSVGSSMNNIDDGYGARIWYVQDTEHWNGTDTFTYKANDGEADSNIATVNITVNPVLDLFSVKDAAFEVDEDNELQVNIDGSFIGTNPDGLSMNDIYFSISPQNGTVTNTGILMMYTPNDNFNGSDTFAYRGSHIAGGNATDSDWSVNEATITITVNPVDDLPTAIDFTASTAEDVSVDIALQYEDVDGDTWPDLTYELSTQPSNGSVELDAAKKVATYTPNSGFFGTDEFVYSTEAGSSESGTVTVTVKEVVGTLKVYPDLTSDYNEWFSDIVYDETTGGFIVAGISIDKNDNGSGGTKEMFHLRTDSSLDVSSYETISTTLNSWGNPSNNINNSAHQFGVSERSLSSNYLLSTRSDYLWLVDSSGGVTYKQLSGSLDSTYRWVDYIKQSYPTSDGGFLIFGTTSKSGNFQDRYPVIAKLDASLNVDYFKVLNNHVANTSWAYYAEAQGMVQAADGVYYLVAGTNRTGISNSHAIQFYKVEDSGSELSVTQHVDLSSSIANSPTSFTSSDDFDTMAYLPGTSDSDAEFVIVTDNNTLTRYNIDSSGNAQVKGTFDLNNVRTDYTTHQTYMEIATGDNDLYVVAQSTVGSSSDINVAKLSESLSVKWEKTLDITSLNQEDKLGGVTVPSSNNALDGFLFITGSTKSSDGDWDGFILVLDGAGNRIY